MSHNYIDFWIKSSISKRKDIFTTTTGVNMVNYGFAKDVTKKSIINSVLDDIFNARRYDLINEIYYDILNFKEILNSDDIFEKVYLWVIEMEGCSFDNYWLYMTLDNFYLIQKKDIQKRIDVCKKSFHEIDLYIPYLKSSQNSINKENDIDNDGTFPNFVFCRDRLIYLLVDAKKFEEAEYYEMEMVRLNLFPGKNGKERFLYNKVYLLSRYVFFLLGNNKPEKAIIKAEEYKKVDSINAAFSYMEIADYFFYNQKYEKAHENYCITLELNPSICGIEKRIQEAAKILNIDYVPNKNIVIQYLRKTEESLTNTYELLSISKRYLDIEEYEKAINVIEQLIKLRGKENTLILHLSTIYKTMAKKKANIKEYISAISYYTSALDVLINAADSTKTIEKQISTITKNIQKLRLKI